MKHGTLVFGGFCESKREGRNNVKSYHPYCIVLRAHIVKYKNAGVAQLERASVF
jgi:hypothetical protein